MLKNFSIFHSPEGYHLTPFYDILSAAPVIENKKISYHDLKLSMCVGDKRRYKISEIQKRHWLQTAKICQFPLEEVELIMHELNNEVDLVLAQVQNQLPYGFPNIVSEPIFKLLRKQLRLLI